ncbi:hypothetical protein D3C87_413060 [compost metagenome]
MLKYQRIYSICFITIMGFFAAGFTFGLLTPENTPGYLKEEYQDTIQGFQRHLGEFRPESQRLSFLEALHAALPNSGGILRYIISNNLYAGFLSVVVGIFGVTPLLQATTEGMRVSWDFQFPSLLPFLFGFHGVLEVFSAMLFQATGLFIFYAFILSLRRRINLKHAAGDVGKLTTLATFLMVIAALLETFPTRILIRMYCYSS